MKHRWNKALALMLALMLTIVAMAIAEEETIAGDADEESVEIVEIESTIEAAEIESVVEEAGEIMLDDLVDIPIEDASIAEEPAAGDASQDTDWNGEETWWFLVGDTAVAMQEAREGDEILRPEDPAAPEGMAFDGWFLEDGTRLFTEDEPVIANPNPLIPDVNVVARFIEAEEPVAEEPTTEEPAAEESTTEEPATEEPTAEEPIVEEPTTEEPAAEEPTAEEPVVEEPVAEEPIAEEPTAEEPVAEEFAVEEPTEEPALDDEPQEVPAPVLPTANELTYTGEAQALVSGEGWLYSLDGESYSAEAPTAINAGEYTVYFIPADTVEAEPQALTVTVAKADVVFTPPVAVTGEA